MAIGNVTVSIPLAMHYGIVGVTIGTMISVLFGNGLIMNLFYHKVLKINMIYFWKEIFRTWKGFILPVCCGSFIMKYVSFENIGVFFLCGFIYVVVYCSSIYCLSCNKEEQQMILDFWGKNKKC